MTLIFMLTKFTSGVQRLAIRHVELEVLGHSNKPTHQSVAYHPSLRDKSNRF